MLLCLSGPLLKLLVHQEGVKACHFLLSGHQLTVLSLYKADRIKGNRRTSLVSVLEKELTLSSFMGKAWKHQEGINYIGMKRRKTPQPIF